VFRFVQKERFLGYSDFCVGRPSEISLPHEKLGRAKTDLEIYN